MASSIQSLAGFTLALLSCGPLAAQQAGGTCPIVDRGSPLDGVTTITLLDPPKSCNEGPLWAGWNCMTLRSDANNNGASYRMEVRWNRVNQPVRGSFVWVRGNFSKQFHRGGLTYATQVQDTLSAVDGVRTIEVRFLGNGTGTYPKNGFPNISSVFADLMEFLVTQGYAAGVTGFFGSSAGATLGANALVFHRIDELIDGFVGNGGPYGVDLMTECTDSSSPSFMTDEQRTVMDAWNWSDTTGASYCSEMATLSNPSYDCLSALGSAADTDLGEMLISVIIGLHDGYKPWINNSAWNWITTVDAQGKAFDEPPAFHQVLKDPDGAVVVYQRIRQIVKAKLGQS